MNQQHRNPEDLQCFSKEGIESKLKEVLLKTDQPSAFFEALRQTEQLEIWFPKLSALIGIEQNPKYHAEGDVWNHTMMVIDAAVQLKDRASNPFGFMLSALTHDFGKAICTEFIHGSFHAYGHEIKGLPIVNEFLCRITSDAALIKYVLNLVQFHMRPNTVANANSAIKVTNSMFDQSVDPEGLICLALADANGRLTDQPQDDHEIFLYERLNIFKETMARPYVTSIDLISAGLKPNQDFSVILNYAHKLRLAGVPKENALKQTLSYARSLNKVQS